MSKHDFYTLPNRAGNRLILGEIIGAGFAIECAAIVNRSPGPVLLIVYDRQTALQLQDEILQLTHHPVLTLLDWETLPYDSFSPHKHIISERINTLYYLPKLTHGIIILPVNTVMQRLCARDFLHSNTLCISLGQHLSIDTLRSHLEQIGYDRSHQVLEHGEFSIHGSLIDLYPMGSKSPYRIDFANNNKINSLRVLNVNTQSILEEVSSVNVLPAREFPTDKASIELFCSQWHKKLFSYGDEEQIYQKVKKNIFPAGIEYWQPLFFRDELVPIFHYLPKNTLIVNIGDIKSGASQFWVDTCNRFHSCCRGVMRSLLPPETLWLNVDNLFAELNNWPLIELRTGKVPKKAGQYNMSYQSLPDLTIEPHNSNTHMVKLRRFYEQYTGVVIFSVESKGRREVLNRLLVQENILSTLINRLDEAKEPGAYLLIGASEHGFIDARRSRALICESNLHGTVISARRKVNSKGININPDVLVCNLIELCDGQPVVHLEHGVGRYAGMATLDTRGIKSEYLVLRYADNDRLYVPVSSLHLVSRYSGSIDNEAPLHKLGGEVWSRTRQKAVDQVRDVAAELLDIYAQRTAKRGFAFHYDQDRYNLFCKGFPFELTVDQAQAINAVLSDMCHKLTMDRLICGDVGFGKTEVAMRAAFLATENHKQVAVLVPTTLLAQQHFDNFRDRFANWPVRIEMISRFRSLKEQSEIITQTAEGKIDILIGTHKILQRDIKWKDLGLLIVDEEHLFGVRHKARIKAMRADVDILTLTATPIPRTLNMAMHGIYDLSIISTPPARRLPVKTFVREYNDLMVREAILREILRGGQVYYLYNDVENIEKAALNIETLVPEARVAIGHGQLCERDLECVMNNFYHQRFNVLVCTTIIETGIDIANANTIIIDRADHFGLAQIHQLRGRVGRSHHQAYAYLLTPPLKTLSKNAQKRLEVISSLEDLGVGFALATHDLEIRGAGQLLGEDQSGQMETIGFSLYMNLLDSAVQAFKDNQEPSLDYLTSKWTEIELRVFALLPEEYIPDVNIRLSFYKRIASITNNHEIDSLQVDLINQFGLLPAPVRSLLAIAGLRFRAQIIGIRRIDINSKGGFIEFNANHKIDPSYLISLIRRYPMIYRFEGSNRLKCIVNLIDSDARLEYVDSLLLNLQQHTLNS